MRSTAKLTSMPLALLMFRAVICGCYSFCEISIGWFALLCSEPGSSALFNQPQVSFHWWQTPDWLTCPPFSVWLRDQPSLCSRDSGHWLPVSPLSFRGSGKINLEESFLLAIWCGQIAMAWGKSDRRTQRQNFRDLSSDITVLMHPPSVT